jgi:hypothetical protein
MVKTRKRDFGVLLAAVAGMVAGLLTLQRGGVDYFGVTGFSGGQAQLLAWSSIALSIILFFIYFRGSRQS